MIVSKESLEYVARRRPVFVEEEENGKFILWGRQSIPGADRKEIYHRLVSVSINGDRRKAKRKFTSEAQWAIEYILGVRSVGGEFQNPEWETPSRDEALDRLGLEWMPQAYGVDALRLKQIWIRADFDRPAVRDLAISCGCDYRLIKAEFIIVQGDPVQANTFRTMLEHRMLSKANRGTYILKEKLVDPCMDVKALKEMLNYLGGTDEYRVTQIGSWPMIADKKTRHVVPIFSGDHFASLDWMDQMTTPRRAEIAMREACREARGNIETDMAPLYELFYSALA